MTNVMPDQSAPVAITDEAIEQMRRDLGVQWPAQGWHSAATYDAIWHFAHGVGDDNPLWYDRGYAEASAVGRMAAPPTFLYSCDNAPIIPGVMQTEDRGGVDTWLPGALGLWAADRWVWHSRVWLDEPIEAVNELWDVAERKSSFSGRSVAQTTRTTFTGEGGRPLAEMYRTIFRFEKSSAIDKQQYLNIPAPRYTNEDRERFRQHHLAEPAARRGGEPRYYEDVTVGDQLPVLLKGPLTITNLVAWLLAWGSPMCQPNRLLTQFLEERPGAGLVHPESGIAETIEGPHWDASLAQLAGLPRGYDFGGQRISWLAHCLTDWCGDAGMLTEFEARLLRPNFLGDAQWIRGAVTSKSVVDGRGLVTCDVEAVNQRDEVTASGVATVELPRR